MYEHDCEVIFTKKYKNIFKNGVLLLITNINTRTRMQDINLNELCQQSDIKTKTYLENHIHQIIKIKDVIQYLNQASFSTTTTTWCEDIENSFFYIIATSHIIFGAESFTKL